ncbi:MAG TPA: hypothetical protein VFT95_06660, partial [Micromonosporaceae bacterium]|nr:hypothetical protein [Micromonosporaceae bacterium]
GMWQARLRRWSGRLVPAGKRTSWPERRSALVVGGVHDSSAHNRRLTAEGISVQAFGLRAKFRQVDRIDRARVPGR